jgi:hypothetical protein
MMSHEWEEFCNRVDEALERMTKATRIHMYATCVSFLACIVALAVFLALFMNGGGLRPLIPIVAVPGTMMFLLSQGTSCYWSATIKRVKQSIIQICEDTSKGNSSLSFHYREETFVTASSGENHSSANTWFIDVSIRQDAVTDVGVSSESAAKRLEDLEAVKSMLSPEEYDEKRARIVAEL